MHLTVLISIGAKFGGWKDSRHSSQFSQTRTLRTSCWRQRHPCPWWTRKLRKASVAPWASAASTSSMRWALLAALTTAWSRARSAMARWCTTSACKPFTKRRTSSSAMALGSRRCVWSRDWCCSSTTATLASFGCRGRAPPSRPAPQAQPPQPLAKRACRVVSLVKKSRAANSAKTTSQKQPPRPCPWMPLQRQWRCQMVKKTSANLSP